MSGLSQRYVSKELLHFVGRGLEQDQQFQLLLKIVSEGWITHPPHNPNISGNLRVNTSAKISNNEMYAPEIVCFSDIPIQDIWIHINKYSAFGLSFSKQFVVSKGGVPVHYVPQDGAVQKIRDMEPGELQKIVSENGHANLIEHMYETVSNADYFDRMLAEYLEVFNMFRDLAHKIDPQPGVSGMFKRVTDLQRFFDFHIFSYFKFFDHMLDDDHEDNYYLEREWRVVGNVQFSLSDIKTIFMPTGFSEKFRKIYPQYSGQVIFVD